MNHEELLKLHRRYWAALKEMRLCSIELQHRLEAALTSDSYPVRPCDIVELLNQQARHYEEQEKEG
jgi:hypothetical protein